MITPNKARPGDHRRGIPVYRPRAATVWRSLECLLGGIAAIFIVLLTFPILIELTQPLHLLSTTGLAAILIFTWLFAWAIISTARERISTAFE